MIRRPFDTVCGQRLQGKSRHQRGVTNISIDGAGQSDQRLGAGPALTGERCAIVRRFIGSKTHRSELFGHALSLLGALRMARRAAGQASRYDSPTGTNSCSNDARFPSAVWAANIRRRSRCHRAGEAVCQSLGDWVLADEADITIGTVGMLRSPPGSPRSRRRRRHRGQRYGRPPRAPSAGTARSRAGLTRVVERQVGGHGLMPDPGKLPG